MSVQYTCDGCGKTEPGAWNGVTWSRPRVANGLSGGGGEWFTREDKKGQHHACSRKCINKIAEEKGVTSCVAPF